MESNPSYDTDETILIKPAHRILVALVTPAQLLHLLCWLTQKEVLVVKELVWYS